MRALLAAGCETFFVACASEGERARAVSGEAVVYVFDGIAPGSAPRLALAGLRPVLNSLAEIAEWAGAGPAALHFDTGMNRLGLAPAEAGEAAALLGPRLSGDEPSRIGAIARRSRQRPPDRRLRRDSPAFSRRSPLAVQLLGNISPLQAASRSGAARLRALRRQSDAGPAQPDARRVAAGGPHSRGPRDRGGGVRGLRRRLDRAAPDAPRHHRRRLRRRAAGRRLRAVSGSRRPKRWSRAAAVPSSGGCRWIMSCST